MNSSTYEEDLRSSIASVSPHFSPKSGTLELPKNSELINLEIIPTPEPTLPVTQPSSSTNTQPLSSISSTLKTRHSPPTALPTNLQVTIDFVTYTVPSKKKYDILEGPFSIDSGILSPVPQAVKNHSQTNTMTVEFLRTHPNFKANRSSLYITPTTCKFRFPQDRNFEHYLAYTSLNLKQLSFWQNELIHYLPIPI